MKVNKTTMLIEDFGNYDSFEMLSYIEDLILYGEFKSPYIQKLFDDWATQCELDCNQSLMMMSITFPQRILLSICRFHI